MFLSSMCRDYVGIFLMGLVAKMSTHSDSANSYSTRKQISSVCCVQSICMRGNYHTESLSCTDKERTIALHVCNGGGRGTEREREREKTRERRSVGVWGLRAQGGEYHPPSQSWWGSGGWAAHRKQLWLHPRPHTEQPWATQSLTDRPTKWSGWPNQQAFVYFSSFGGDGKLFHTSCLSDL